MPQPQLTDGQAVELNAYYLANPVRFVCDVLGANPWQKQQDIIEAVFHYRNVAVKTCNSVGKSYIAARIAVAYLILHPDSIVVTTAPTWNQVTNVLWREIANAVKMSKYKLTEKQVNQAGLTLDVKWYAIGVSTRTPDNMMGFHADHLLVIVDEAGGVEDIIFQGVKAITTNVNNKVLLIGNPTTPGGVFWNAFEPGSMYKQFSVSAFDTPNLTANGIYNVDDLLEVFKLPPDIHTDDQKLDYYQHLNTEVLKIPYPELITPGTVFERYYEWGIDSPAWQALILGQFPSQSAQSLLPIHLVTMAMNMYGTDDETGMPYSKLSGWEIPDGAPEFGQDMARFGDDSTVMTPRAGGWTEKQIVWNKTDLMASADKILENLNPLDPDTRINIDDTGNGGGTTDRLRQISRDTHTSGRPMHQYQIVAYDFSKGPSNPDKFHDITSELYWNLRSWFYNKQIALHYDKKLFEELVGRRWEITPQKKIKVESKADYKERTKGRSPDRSDSLALAFAGPIRQKNEKTSDNQTPTQLQYRERQQAAGRPLTSGMNRGSY